MNGLYHKALAFHEQGRSMPADQPDTEEAREKDGISAEERDKIASRIDRIMAENRVPISPGTLVYTAKRRGEILPIISNVVILVMVVLAGLLASRLLNHQEQDIASGQAVVQGAENKLIEALKRDAARQLQERDQSILAAQQKLQALGSDAEKLRAQTNSIVATRSQELQGQFDQRLSLERDRLKKEGLGAAAQAERMRQFEAAQRRDLERQLAAARQRAEADLAAKEKSIADLTAQYQKDLETARQERVKAQGELAQKEADLRSQAAQAQAAAQSAAQVGSPQGAAAQTDAARVSDELARMQADRAKEQLILDQILAGYDRVNHALQASDYAAALSGLDVVRGYFNDPAIAALPTIQKRRAVELFLVGSLDELIRSHGARATADAASLVQDSTDLKAVSEMVARGDALSQAGNLPAAREAYLSAIEKIPYVSHGYARLQELRPPEQAVGSPELISGLRQANVFYEAGNLRGSVEQYRAAVNLIVKDDALAKQITDNVMNAGYRLLAANDLAALSQLRTSEEKRQAIIARLREIKTQYQAYAQLSPESSAAAPSSEASLASLLQAKILVRQILDSEPVRSKYPDLGATIEQYFTALEKQGRTDGRKAALADLAAVFARLESSNDAGAGLSMANFPTGTAADPLLALLDQLTELLSEK